MLQIPFEQPMLVAVPIERSVASELHTSFSISFWIEFYHLDTVCRHKNNKRNKMFFCHGVMNRKKILIFYGFDRQNMFVIRVLGFQCG